MNKIRNQAWPGLINANSNNVVAWHSPLKLQTSLYFFLQDVALRSHQRFFALVGAAAHNFFAVDASFSGSDRVMFSCCEASAGFTGRSQ